MIQQGTKGVVFNIQRYSIHDGPGIRSTVFLKGCPLKCFWCQNPESQRAEPEVFLNKTECIRCGRCVDVCPAGASTLGDKTAIIDRNKCIGCGKCVTVCLAEARRLVGRRMTVEEVLLEALRDVMFYKNSGGGVTLSGGEPTAQARFSVLLLRSCKDAGLHTVLDTCGYISWETLEQLLRYTDLVLYDIKHLDTRKHYTATGAPNQIILQNAKRVAHYRPMRVRVPIIPGFNDSANDARSIARFVRAELGPVDIDLLPYNKMGEVKYEYLDRQCVPVEARDEGYVQTLETIMNEELMNSKTCLERQNTHLASNGAPKFD